MRKRGAGAQASAELALLGLSHTRRSVRTCATVPPRDFAGPCPATARLTPGGCAAVTTRPNAHHVSVTDADNVRMTRPLVHPLNRVAYAFLCLVVLGAVAACSPIQDGKAGITRDATGHLVGLVKACEGKYDGAGIYQDDDPNAQTMVHVAEWSRQDASGGLLTWGLEEGAPSMWTTTRPLTADALTAGHAYVLDAFGDNQKWSADDLRFAVEDLAAITPDTVLVAKTDPKTGQSGHTLIPRDEFTASACRGDTR